jgi:hypothetical protein
MKYIKLLFRILKAPWIILKLDPFYYGVCTKRHPKLKVIPNKKYLVALMNKCDFKQESYEKRKSMRNNNVLRFFSVEYFIDRVIEINASNKNRQGKATPDYFNDKEAYLKEFKDKNMIGIFKEYPYYKLIAFGRVVRSGDISIIGPFMGHSDYLKEGIMYHLIDSLIAESQTDWIMYDTFLGNTKGLTYFKKKLGFKEYNVKWIKDR